MGAWLTIVFWVLAVLATWMTATAIIVLRARRDRLEDMTNLYEQVVGAVRAGDLPRAVLLLEGEPGPLATLLSSILTEATKFTPKLRVAYKITLESLKRRSLVTVSPLRAVMILALIFGVMAFLSPLAAVFQGATPVWTHTLAIFILSMVIALIAQILYAVAARQDRENLIAAGDMGRNLLTVLLGKG